jgi:hypothetical protein
MPARLLAASTAGTIEGEKSADLLRVAARRSRSNTPGSECRPCAALASSIQWF